MQSSFVRSSIALLRRKVAPQNIRLRRYATETETKAQSSIERIEARLPRFLRRYVTPLRTAPVSHIAAFLILHELTAVVPLFALAGYFHYTNWLPPLMAEGLIYQKGVEYFGKTLRRYNIIDDTKDNRRSKWFGRGEAGTRVVVELATAYAITKLLLPVRLPLSVLLTPWFARWSVLPIKNMLRGGLRSKTAARGSASTGVPTGPISKTMEKPSR